jgi:hypothetical protein
MKVFKLHEFINQDAELIRVLRHLPKPDENGPWLAGGSVWKAIEGLPLDCDVDFFFKDKVQYDEYLRKLKSIPYVYHVVTEKKNDYNITFGFHIYEKGYNKTVPLQFVSFRLCNSLEELLNSFDFTVCQFGFDGQRLMVGDTSLEDLKSRIIRFNNVADCANTAYHVKKYLDKGFSIPPDQQQHFEELMKKSCILPRKEPDSDRPFVERLRTLAEDGYPHPRPVRNNRVGIEEINNILASIPEPADSVPNILEEEDGEELTSSEQQAPAPPTPFAPYIPLYNTTELTTVWGTTTINHVITTST